MMSGLLESYAICIKESNLETRVLMSGRGNEIGSSDTASFLKCLRIVLILKNTHMRFSGRTMGVNKSRLGG